MNSADEQEANGTQSQPPKMSVISQAYDRNGKGYLDPTEKAMRELDESGRGHLSNEAVYEILLESTTQTKKLATQRWLLIALACFTIVLALANMATAFAAASLAKDTTVTKAGEFVVKGNEDTTITTAAKGRTFNLGGPVTGAPAAADEASGGDARRRQRRMEGLMVNLLNEFGWNGHSSVRAQDAEALFYAYSHGFQTRLNWTCGFGHDGPKYVEEVLGASVLPYTQNITDDATNETTTESGKLYQLQVGGGNQNSGVRGEAKVLFIDCAELSDQDILASNYFLNGLDATCTVTGTGCCATWNDLESGERRDDCPEFRTCNPCGCTCGEAGLFYGLRCDTSCGFNKIRPIEAQFSP
eukprot:CAMPEP_0181042876 /NCGR_PEP_ID=MMETSP1070-20121207/12395_1 /TAXON_ID=265543 /ORGANISM="Minutocellus polymorphus, Strain NH13" /LENGTH=356 /DNA_ID=CAMNT_0023121141 /DNA_START=84 /DNA_END=1154 /DNA_ORIENTATION=+